METKDLVQQALQRKFTEFDQGTKKILMAKVAEKLKEKGYFEKLDHAKGLYEAKETYKEFMNKKLKKFGVKSPAELEGADKKKFFDEVDAEWDGKDEKPELGDK